MRPDGKRVLSNRGYSPFIKLSRPQIYSSDTTPKFQASFIFPKFKLNPGLFSFEHDLNSVIQESFRDEQPLIQNPISNSDTLQKSTEVMLTFFKSLNYSAQTVEAAIQLFIRQFNEKIEKQQLSMSDEDLRVWIVCCIDFSQKLHEVCLVSIKQFVSTKAREERVKAEEVEMINSMKLNLIMHSSIKLINFVFGGEQSMGNKN